MSNPLSIQLAVSAISGLVGVALGFGLVELREWHRRKRRRKGHWSALKAEIEFIGRAAAGFLQAGVQSPLYRLPAASYEVALPILLTDEALMDGEIDALLRFYSEADTFNRGLDLADRALGDDDRLKREVNRISRKAKRLTKDDGELYKAALAVVQSHL